MKYINKAQIRFLSRSGNESFARGAAAAFLTQYDPTVVQLADIRTAISETVTNCIVHAYPGRVGLITMICAMTEDGRIRISIADQGVGIEDVEKAMEPLFTTGNPDEQAGLGFAVMKSFMDTVKVVSKPGKGTRVTMTTKLREKAAT